MFFWLEKILFIFLLQRALGVQMAEIEAVLRNVNVLTSAERATEQTQR